MSNQAAHTNRALDMTDEHLSSAVEAAEGKNASTLEMVAIDLHMPKTLNVNGGANQLNNEEPLNRELSQEEGGGNSSVSFVSQLLLTSRASVANFFRARWPRLLVLVLAVLLYHALLVAALRYAIVYKEGHLDYCDGVGLLVVLTALAYWTLVYYKLIKPNSSRPAIRKLVKPASVLIAAIEKNRFIQTGLLVVAFVAVIVYVVLEAGGKYTRLVSAGGAVAFIFLTWVFSKHPDKVRWRHVIWGMSLQIVFGLLILKWPVGRSMFECAGNKIKTFLDFTNEGSTFVFGSLASGNPFILAFMILPVIIFFSFATQILYYFGAMHWIIVNIGWLLQVTVGTTACESANAAANIFVGQTEAPLVIRPFLSKLTMSELHAVMTGGFATIAGSVLAAYVQFGVSASHLLSASVMSAPAALAIAKLSYPESQVSKTKVSQLQAETSQYVNLLDAASHGAMSMVKVCGYIAASLIAFISFISFLNSVFSWAGQLVGFKEMFGFPLTFQYVASLVMVPVALMMGVPWVDCTRVGELLALKIVLNEFVAFSTLKTMSDSGLLTARSITISTYALCGFSNFSSIGIQISGLGAMATERRSDLSQLAMRAMIAGNVACFLTACIAGTLVDDNDIGGALQENMGAAASAFNSTTGGL